DEPLARPAARPRLAERGHGGDRDPVEEPQQVRARQADRAPQARPRALLGRALSRRLRLHPAHARRGRRPRGHPHAHQRVDVPRVHDRRAADRRAAHARQGRAGRQDPRRPLPRPVLQRLPRPQQRVGALPQGGGALLPHLQGPRGEARRDPGVAARRRRAAHRRGVGGAVRGEVPNGRAV
ncbi:MAG: Inorganic pyrophosphatase, partial [uncultured Gemmatimonadaceae bacterium]